MEKETMLSCMVERQNSAPSEKNIASMFNALKDAYVYMPAKLIVSKEEQQRILKAVKNKQKVPQPSELKVAPQLLINSNGEKVMPWFSREVEFQGKVEGGINFLRLKVEKIVEMADNMPDAFDIVIDPYTHPVQVTLDEMIEGIGGPVAE